MFLPYMSYSPFMEEREQEKIQTFTETPGVEPQVKKLEDAEEQVKEDEIKHVEKEREVLDDQKEREEKEKEDLKGDEEEEETSMPGENDTSETEPPTENEEQEDTSEEETPATESFEITPDISQIEFLGCIDNLKLDTKDYIIGASGALRAYGWPEPNKDLDICISARAFSKLGDKLIRGVQDGIHDSMYQDETGMLDICVEDNSSWFKFKDYFKLSVVSQGYRILSWIGLKTFYQKLYMLAHRPKHKECIDWMNQREKEIQAMTRASWGQLDDLHIRLMEYGTPAGIDTPPVSSSPSVGSTPCKTCGTEDAADAAIIDSEIEATPGSDKGKEQGDNAGAAAEPGGMPGAEPMGGDEFGGGMDEEMPSFRSNVVNYLCH